MRQFTAIIVDDEANNRQNLVTMLAKHCPQINVLAEASNVKEAQHIIKTTSPEVVFLDIEMPGGNGFTLLDSGDIPFKVIFVTAYDAYALKAIKFSALDYLLKPIDKEELVKAVGRLKSNSAQTQEQRVQNLGAFLNQEEKKIAISLTDEIRLVPLKSIVRLQADNNYCKFFLSSGEEILTSKNLGYYYDLLKDQDFSRVHQSHLVNRQRLERYVKKDGGYLVLSNGDQVPVSRTQREQVARLFGSI